MSKYTVVEKEKIVMRWNCKYEELEKAIDDVENPETITYLDVSAYRFCERSIKILSKLSSLRVLIMKNCSGVDDVLIMVSFLNLQELSLSSTDVTDVGMKYVGRMVNLKKLDLSKCHSEQLTLLDGYLDKLSLCELNVQKTHFSDDAFYGIFRMKSLRKLNVGYCRSLTECTLEKGVRKMVNLEWLNLVACNVSCDLMRELVYLRSLVYLDMSLCRLEEGEEDEGFKILGKCKNLEELYLERTNVDDGVLNVLGELKYLKKLDVSECSVTNLGLSYLSRVDDVCCKEMFSYVPGPRRKVVRDVSGVWGFVY